MNLPTLKNGKPGQPTKLTPQLQQRFAECLLKGHYLITACTLCGINEQTYYNWLQRAREGDSRYFGFFEAVKSAQAEFEAKTLGIITDAMPTSWQAAMTMLERRFPERWGRGVRVQHEGTVHAKIEIEKSYYQIEGGE